MFKEDISGNNLMQESITNFGNRIFESINTVKYIEFILKIKGLNYLSIDLHILK